MLLLKCITVVKCVRHLCTNVSIMKYLNVAEKNDAAKNIAALLSRGVSRKREGLSKYNKIYEFDHRIQNEPVKMVMTSVSGHLLTYEFSSTFRKWTSCNPIALFDAPVLKSCPPDFQNIKKTLEREIRTCQGLIIWTDCDREGENIGFEVIKVCKEANPNIRILRAKFSEITSAAVNRAINNLETPNENISKAVDVRQELDLRTGAAFTRLQTLHLTKVFPRKLVDKLISYGSCQFPTLGFVVERFKDRESFIEEPFWKIKLVHTKGELSVEFNWDRERLFAKMPCQAILDVCKENPEAIVESVISKPKNKWRPLPLDTVEMEKNISKKLKINAKEAMRIAERLYTQGLISYPRTETNIFPQGLNLRPLIEAQTGDQRWGEFAARILNDSGPNPRQGKKSDQAHPPIHPIKSATNLTGNDQRVYEYIVRHFLACVSKDAVGHETIVKVRVARENFTAKGLVILEKNYLEVYIYEKWTGKELHRYTEGEKFTPTVLEMMEGHTSPPNLLTEADLIALMDKNGIGTDATHADHIDTIKSREYVGLTNDIYFVPGQLGMGLVEGYDSIGLEISLAKPILRSNFEADLKLICDGLKAPEIVLREQILKYRAMFESVVDKMNQLEEKLELRIEESRNASVQNTNATLPSDGFMPVLTCPKCNKPMVLKMRKNNAGYYVCCTSYPACKNAIWFPSYVETVEVLTQFCRNCGPDVKLLKIKFRPGQNPFFRENPMTLCIGGCDTNVLETLNINLINVLADTNNSNQTRTTNNVNNESRNTRNNSAPTTFSNSNTNNTINSRRSSNSSTTNTVNNITNSNNRNASVTNITSNASNFNNTNNNRITSSDSANNTWIQPNDGLRNNTAINRTSSSNNVRRTSSSNSQHDDVVCNCNTPALRLIVKKEGPNKGRYFYRCQRDKDVGGCNYFLWAADEDSNTNQTVNGSFSTTTIPPASDNNLVCDCGQQAVQRIVQKEGANKGRTFYTCPNPMGSKCNFFKWADEVNTSMGSSQSGSGGGYSTRGQATRGRGAAKRGGTKRKAPSSSTGTAKKRKCGICGEEGHIRTNCPNAR